MTILKKYNLLLVGVVLGGAAGFIYWNYFGCTTGQCAMTSVWYNSTMYGSLIGGLLASSFSKTVKSE